MELFIPFILISILLLTKSTIIGKDSQVKSKRLSGEGVAQQGISGLGYYGNLYRSNTKR